jgi:hypothetical protein
MKLAGVVDPDPAWPSDDRPDRFDADLL